MRAEIRQLWLQVSRSGDIVRRYSIVNGFDGALTMLGMITGFYLSGVNDLQIVIAACLGAAVALAISGLTSAYLSESAERQKSLNELEDAMVTDLSDSVQASAAKLLPLLIALVNGVSPLLLSLVIISPLWVSHAGFNLPVPAIPGAIAAALLCIFLLGAFLGRIGGTSWLWSGIKSLLIAGLTMSIIILLER